MKPPLTIDLVAPEGNVYALVAKATATLKEAGQPVQARILRDWFKTVPPGGGVSYGDVQRMIEMFCDVKWLNNPLPPDVTDAVPRLLAAMAEAATGGKPYLITYDFTESGVTQRCGFLCTAENVRAAAESFWGQHPGPWFTLISVNDGSIEAFWQARQGRFVTIPEREERAVE
jgi:hypothetical protein